MITTNRDVFALDPTVGDIPNLGVAKVRNPEDEGDWATLEWELRSFVCEGEYERGLERILDQFLSHLSQPEQPAAWVSGFYGSGKSHLMRVLEYLWRDYELPSGVSARGVTHLPDDIKKHIAELSLAGKREGGLWSAAGTLGAGAAGSVRLAFLEIVLGAARLPQQYAPARLSLWMKNEGLFDRAREAVEDAGKSFDHELRNLYVSPALAQALIDAGAPFGDTPAEVSKTLQAQFPIVEDISNDEMLNVFEDVLRLQMQKDGSLPLTLVVLDELQQYIDDDNQKAEHVQHLVEGCSSRFGSRVLVVATGQAALTANPTLQKLIDRFAIAVALSDTDVETVVRKVVLRKKAEAVDVLQTALDKESGEIDQHLRGTRLEPTGADKAVLVADYPILPTRRRFWERALRAIDRAGKAGMLRSQLKIVHEATRSVADRPIGFVIGADFLFRSESASMLMSGALLQEIDDLIRGLDDGSDEGRLRSRICSMVYLIGQLPHEGIGDTGLRATAPMISDLLVEDLANDGERLRRDVPRLLEELFEEGRLVKLTGDEYLLQTEEGAEWTKDFNQRRAVIQVDTARLAQLRNEWLLRAVDEALSGLKLVHGESKTPRKLRREWGEEEPGLDGGSIPIWFRDGWGVSESKVKESAAAAGVESPVVHVLLPRLDTESERDALATYAAAQDTVNQRPEPQTDEGRQAKQGMQSRVADGERRLQELFENIVAGARVFQGGGNEVSARSLRDAVAIAAESALKRLFPKFGVADNPAWDKVIAKARDGAPDALIAVGYTGDVPANPVCKEVLDRISGAGTGGAEIQRQLSEPGYGWPADAINGALLALLGNGNIRAERDGLAVSGLKELPPTQLGKATFFKEDEPPSTKERMAVRGVLTEARIPYDAGQEGAAISGLLQHVIDLAGQAGGPPPLPDPPDVSHVEGLRALAGNQQFREVAKQNEQLREDIKLWATASEHRTTREAAWGILERLLNHAAGLDGAVDIRKQRDAIAVDRLLLVDPDPVSPLISSLAAVLRDELTTAISELRAEYTKQVADLEASAEWQQLEASDRSSILKQVGLEDIREPSLSTDEQVLSALDAAPLSTWMERRQALSRKVGEARELAAKKLEPKSVTVRPRSATLKTPGDVDEYVDALRAELMEHVDADETVIV